MAFPPWVPTITGPNITDASGSGGRFPNLKLGTGFRLTNDVIKNRQLLELDPNVFPPVNVAGAVSISNWPSIVGVSGSLSVFTTGPQNVSGSVNVTVSGSTGLQVHVDNFPGSTPANITGGVNVFTSGLQGVSGSVGVFTSGPQNVSGSVALTNWPATVGVSGSVTVGGWAANVTGSVAVTTSGSTGLQTHVDNFPATQNVSFNAVAQPVSMSNQPTVVAQVTTSGSTGLQTHVDNFPTQFNVSTTGSVGLQVAMPAGVTVSATGSTGLLITGSVASAQPGVFTTFSSSYWAANSVTANITMPSVGIAGCWDQAWLWTINSGLSANTLTGSIALRNSNDNVNFNDAVQANQTRVALALGPGNLVQSGSFVGVPHGRFARLELNFAAGSGCSLTSSYNLNIS